MTKAFCKRKKIGERQLESIGKKSLLKLKHKYNSSLIMITQKVTQNPYTFFISYGIMIAILQIQIITKIINFNTQGT